MDKNEQKTEQRQKWNIAWRKIHCCARPYRDRIRPGMLKFSIRNAKFQFNSERFDYRGRESTDFCLSDALAFCIDKCTRHEKCALKILIKFIYINAVKLFRIACCLIPHTHVENWTVRSSSEIRREGETRKNIIFPIAWRKANIIELESPKMTRAQIKFNVIEVIVQMYMLNDPWRCPSLDASSLLAINKFKSFIFPRSSVMFSFFALKIAKESNSLLIDTKLPLSLGMR